MSEKCSPSVYRDESLAREIDAQRPGHALSRRFYTDPAIFERETSQVILRHWHCAGHASSVANPGDFLNVELCGESVLVLCGQDHVVRALVNVCRHRGSRLCRDTEGTLRGGVLVCPYHGWTYGWDGQLRSARHSLPNSDRSAHGLKQLHVLIIEGLVFVSFAERPLGVEHVREALAASARVYGWKDAKIVQRETYSICANWKLVVENYYECFHCAPAHPEFSRFHIDARSTTQNAIGRERIRQQAEKLGLEFVEVDRWVGRSMALEEPAGAVRSALVEGAVSGSDDGGPVSTIMGGLPDYDGGITFFDVGPTSAFLAYPDYGVIYRFMPRTVSTTGMEVIWLVDKNAREGIDYDRERVTWLWRVTSAADKRIIETNQEGVNSRYYEPGPYAPKESYTQRFSEWLLEELR